MDWKRMLGIKRESRENQSGSSKEVKEERRIERMGNTIYKPEVKYPDENGEVRIPDEAIAVQRQVEEIKVSNSGIESDIVRVYYSYLIPVSQEAEPEPEVKEEPKRQVLVARKR
jgi:hypothetical protein